MSGRIFHHPVGSFPLGARWYLACIATLALICMAMHLSIQERAQKEAESLVRQWGAAANIEVGDVHYHLLRNALILRQIAIVRSDDYISIRHMLLRANPNLLTSQSPQIHRVEIAGLEANISYPEIDQTWQQDETLSRLWRAASSLQLGDGIVTVYPRSREYQPLVLTGLALRQRILDHQRSITAAAQLGAADLHWQWQTDDKGGRKGNGRMGWQRLDAGLLATSLGLQPIRGELRGQVSWGNEGPSAPGLEGSMELTTGRERPAGHLQWQATATGDSWQVDTSATAWPLAAWSEILPQIGGRSFLAGNFSGALLWQGRMDNWQISSEKGELQDVVYGHPGDQKLPQWHWQRLAYEEILLIAAEQQLSAASLLLADGDITLQPQTRLIQKQDENPLPVPAWRLRADSIQAENLTLGLQLERGRVEAPALHGHGRWGADGLVSFELKSKAATPLAEPLAEPDTKQIERELWQLQGRAQLKQDAPPRAWLNLQASHVPLPRLRPLIPFEDASDKPITMAGQLTALKLNMEATEESWKVWGDANAETIELGHAGDILNIEQMAVKFGPVGIGLPSQKIEQLDIRGWQYVTTLSPLSPSSTSQATATAVWQPWWTTVMRRHGWSMDTALWLGGTISVGNADALWAEGVDIQLKHLQPKQWADISMRGYVGGGDFSLSGAWDVLGGTGRFKGAARLDNALPFFLSNWMNTSGMPRPLRGRLSARLTVADVKETGIYRASTQIRLRRGLTRVGVFPKDPLITRIGYSTNDSLALLADDKGNATLSFDVEGEWQEAPLTLQRLGLALQSTLQARIKEHELLEHAVMHDPGRGETLLTVQMRLHDGGSLSLNERARLHKAVRALRGNRGRVLDLLPNWAGEEMNAEVLARIADTQQLIERYMAYRGIGKERIFPLWPTEQNRVEGIGSISLIVRQPQSSPE